MTIYIRYAPLSSGGDTSGFVPYVGATANLNLGLFKLVDNANVNSLSPDLRALYDSTGNKTLNWASGELLSDPTTLSLDWINRQSFYPDGTTVSVDYGAGVIRESGGGISVDYNNWTLYSSNIPIFNWQTGVMSDNWGGYAMFLFNRQLIDTTGNHAIVDWQYQTLKDGSGTKAMEWSVTYRQLLDFGGSYPSVDFGNYTLPNIGISNSIPLLDWSTSAGGGVKIANAYYGVVGDFTNLQLLNTGLNVTLDWGLRVLYDNTNSASVDWDYHILSYSGGTHVDWQNCLLSVAGFTAVSWFDRTLRDGTGTTVVLDWSAQQDTSVGSATLASPGAGSNIKSDDTFDGYTLQQVVAALRVYGLLA